MKEVDAGLGEWKFHFTQAGLSPSEDIEAIAAECKLFRPPTIVFGKSSMSISHASTGFSLFYDAKEALRLINYEQRKKQFTPAGVEEVPINNISYLPERLQVKHAEHWQGIEKPKDIEISELKQASDSFFLTSFKGKVGGQCKAQRVKEAVIPVDKLGPQNPIVFYHQGSLYEDELDDNGLIQYEYKFRSMAGSWFGLIRNYARIDEVAVHIYDTRLYWEEGWKKIGRQFMVKTATWAELKNSQFDFPMGWNMNPNQSHFLYPHLKERFVDNEYLHFA